MANQQDYVEIGLDCADICTALDRGMNGKRVDDLSQSVCKAIGQLTLWVTPTTRILWLADDVLELPRISTRRPSNKRGATMLPDLSTQRAIRTRLFLGN